MAALPCLGAPGPSRVPGTQQQRDTLLNEYLSIDIKRESYVLTKMMFCTISDVDIIEKRKLPEFETFTSELLHNKVIICKQYWQSVPL